MLDFGVYKGNELQNFLAMLNQCESYGVTDIRFVRERLQSHVNTQFAAERVRRVSVRNQDKLPEKIQFATCPSCGNKTLHPARPIEGMQRVGCKCGYSEVIG